MKMILVAVSDEALLDNLKEILTMANYRVVTATNGKEALEQVCRTMPDLVISDIVMPVLNGYDMFSSLRANPATSKLPVIFLTSKSERKDYLQAIQDNAANLIIKPFSGDDLLLAVEDGLNRVRTAA